MEEWKKKRDSLLDPYDDQVMIASHRGKFSSSVMENTSLAFLAAVGQGADMVEMDLAMTSDGVLVGHHDDNMTRLFHDTNKISDYTLEELRKKPLYNYVGEICEEEIETFDQITDALKNKALLVLQAGPSLMFITIPKVFASMGLGTPVGILFFVLVLCAALTSSIALTESAVSTFQDELKWCRQKSTLVVGVIMIVLGSLSSLGYGPLGFVKIIGMQFLDFFDFLTNSVMMPIAALATCLLVSRVIGVKKIEEEVMLEGGSFKRKRIFNFMIKYLCPIFAVVILLSSVANAFGWISM